MVSGGHEELMFLFYRLETMGWSKLSKGIDDSSGRALKQIFLGFSSVHSKITPFSIEHPLIS